MEKKIELNIQIEQTTPLKSPEGNQVFQEAFVLRKASKFLVGTKDDAIIPIQVYIDVKTNKILTELLPIELRSEYEEYNKTA